MVRLMSALTPDIAERDRNVSPCAKPTSVTEMSAADPKRTFSTAWLRSNRGRKSAEYKLKATVPDTCTAQRCASMWSQ